MSTGTRARAPIFAALTLLAALALWLQLGDAEPGLAYLAPALLLFAVLAHDRYPGERLLAAVVRTRRPRFRRERRAPARPFASHRLLPRGGVLLSTALAGRGPPG